MRVSYFDIAIIVKYFVLNVKLSKYQTMASFFVAQEFLYSNTI